MFTYKLQRKLTSELIRTMVKKKRAKKIYNWITRGYKDALKGTPYAHAPAKNIENIDRTTWTPEMEQYWDGYSSALQDMKEGKVQGAGESLPASPN